MPTIVSLDLLRVIVNIFFYANQTQNNENYIKISGIYVFISNIYYSENCIKMKLYEKDIIPIEG